MPISPALLPSWMADGQPGRGPVPSERAERAGRLARHPLVMDVAVAAAVAAGTSLVDAFGSLPGGAVGWDLLLAAPLVLRRRWPAWAAALIAVVCLAQWLAGVRATGDVAFLVALYSLGAYERRRWILASAVVIAEVQKLWKTINPHDDFAWTFLDDDIADLYQQEQRLSGLLRSAMIIAIAISCMGLLGLATFAAEQRQKEISIRKVLGAPVLRIFRMLTADFLWPVALAFIIAAPVAWYFMHGWLQGFVYRAAVPWWIFGCCGLAAFVIAMLTVGAQTLRAAYRNPVEALRAE